MVNVSMTIIVLWSEQMRKKEAIITRLNERWYGWRVAKIIQEGSLFNDGTFGVLKVVYHFQRIIQSHNLEVLYTMESMN